MAEFEKAADDFAKKRFGCAGTLPDRLVEVCRCCAYVIACSQALWEWQFEQPGTPSAKHAVPTPAG